jgi:hypothetical protein
MYRDQITCWIHSIEEAIQVIDHQTTQLYRSSQHFFPTQDYPSSTKKTSDTGNNEDKSVTRSTTTYSSFICHGSSFHIQLR